MYVRCCTTLVLFITFHMKATRQKNIKPIEWVDSQSRFLARVSTQQDCPPLVRLEIRLPRVSESFSGSDVMEEHLEDNIFIELQSIIILRPYLPRKAKPVTNPPVSDVSVCVDNFWSMSESGGNSGRVVRHGIIYVGGETEALQRLCGEKDTRFTANVG
jgi:hypothetical protein